ncbi:MAG: cysteine hydrolase [Burkholderiales bacterium]|nr:cysteine hydrolase [Burkholderiales bacterium]
MNANATAKRNLQLLIIDPQNDFCDLPAPYLLSNLVIQNKPALHVTGAHQDMLRIANLIHDGATGISAINVTLDSHHHIDIAHPTFWMDNKQQAIPPFTQILASQVRAGQYQPRLAQNLPRTLAYLDALEATGRYTLMVWPIHCEIGSWGQAVHADMRYAYNRWEEVTMNSVNLVQKGANPWTEHYSALQAEVPDSDDDETQLNRGLLAVLAQADKVYIGGEAGSHCVKATVEHLVANTAASELSKYVLLTDCISAVGGFEAQQASFFQEMAARGVQLATAAQVLPELIANAE